MRVLNIYSTCALTLRSLAMSVTTSLFLTLPRCTCWAGWLAGGQCAGCAAPGPFSSSLVSTWCPSPPTGWHTRAGGWRHSGPSAGTGTTCNCTLYSVYCIVELTSTDFSRKVGLCCTKLLQVYTLLSSNGSRNGNTVVS